MGSLFLGGRLFRPPQSAGAADLALSAWLLSPAQFLARLWQPVTGARLFDHAGCGGIQQLPLRASRKMARGWRPWLRAVVREERMRQWRRRGARVRQQPLIFAASL